MKISKQDVIVSKENIESAIIVAERAARVCYNSVEKQTGKLEDAVKFLKNLIGLHHTSVLEHCNITAEFHTNIGVSREFERHRHTHFGFKGELCTGFSERSTRYCNYGKDSKYPDGVEFCPSTVFIEKLVNDGNLEAYEEFLSGAEENYLDMLKRGYKAQEARSLLPLCTKTVFIATANLREWRWIMELRTSNAAHPDIIELMTIFKEKLFEAVPQIEPLFE